LASRASEHTAAVASTVVPVANETVLRQTK